MEKEEAAEVLRQIDTEFDHEHQKILDQRKQIADVNRVRLYANLLRTSL